MEVTYCQLIFFEEELSVAQGDGSFAL